MKKPLSYCAQAVFDHARDRFYASLFVPEPARERLLTLCALDVELAHIRRAVTEEMLGHMRHAWWQESIEAILEGKRPREHPVFQAIAQMVEQVDRAQLLALLENYRVAFPNLPENDAALDALCESVIPAEAKLGWQRAKTLIEKHRARFGARWNGWLVVKLLWVGAAR